MIKIPTLSFCITCKNRFYQISQTLRKNLDDNRLHKEWIEFILVDFGSTDGLHDWIIVNFVDDLKSGYLRYYYTEELRYWHMSIAKNTTHWCANNDIVVNLDCDNFTGYQGGQFLIRKFLKDGNIVCHQFSGDLSDGSCGRISVLKKYFDYIGGYDESFEPIGFDDIDLISRLRRVGLKYCLASDEKYCAAIKNTKEESLININSSYTYSIMNKFNRDRSYKNIDEGHLIVNNGIYGIRRNLIDYSGRLHNGETSSLVSNHSDYFYLRSTLKDKICPETMLELLKCIAKYSRLLSSPGLFNGKMGVAILMYQGSRYYRSPLLEKAADTLIDDIIEEAPQVTSHGFTKGLSGIAWGIDHLMSNEFIEFDGAWFDAIDRVLFNDEEVTGRRDEAEYPFLGLYILSCYENSPDKNYWITQAGIYCIQMLRLLEIKQYLFTNNPFLLIPFLYCLLKWKEYDLPYISLEIIGKVFQSLHKITFINKQIVNNAFANYLYHKLLQQDVLVQLPEILTIKDINAVYFNQLLYPDIFLFPEKILSESFSLIIADEKMQKELLLFLNPETVGLSQYISGFAWSLLQYNYARL